MRDYRKINDNLFVEFDNNDREITIGDVPRIIYAMVASMVKGTICVALGCGLFYLIAVVGNLLFDLIL